MDVFALHKTVKISDTTRKINTFRVSAAVRILILLFLLAYRILNPIENAFLLWLFGGFCEFMFFLNFLVYTILRWTPIERATFPERLARRHEKSGELNTLLPVDVFIATADPIKEPPVITANTILSVLAVDYPVDKVACYVSDDSASPVTLAMMFEVSEFAQKWIPFVKKFSIQTPAPAAFFAKSFSETASDSLDYLNQMNELRGDYKKFNARVNYLAANPDLSLKFVMDTIGGFPDGSPNDHPSIVEVINKNIYNHCQPIVPLLVYVAREKRIGYEHHFKAGAMNALLRISEAFTARPVILNLDCDMYVNDAKSLKHAMCFLMDPGSGEDVAFVQFPQIFDNLGKHDLYGSRLVYFYEILYKGLDSLQGPFYCGTGCFHRREVLYGLRRGSKLQSSLVSKELSLNNEFISRSSRDLKLNERKNKFEDSVIEASRELCKCSYENQTSWGKEKGWRYGSITEDLLTGYKIHCQGWRSIYFYPKRPVFKGLASTVVSDRLIQKKRVAVGLGNILFSKSSPFHFSCSGLTILQRMAYAHMSLFYAGISIFIVMYQLLHVACLFSHKSLLPKISEPENIVFGLAALSYYVLGYLEFKWAGGDVQDWWNHDRLWFLTNMSAFSIGTIESLFIFMGLMKKGFDVTPKNSNEDSTPYLVSDSPLFIPLVMLVIMFLGGILFTLIHVVCKGMYAINVMGGEMAVAIWCLVILYPILRQLFGRKNITPLSVMFPALLGTGIFFLLVQCL